MPDSSAIDTALYAALANDSTLMALMTDGVYWDVAESGKTKFVVVSLVVSPTDYAFQHSVMEQPIYLVKAVERSATAANVRTAAARIRTLLDGVALSITGYDHLLTRLDERVRYTEVDDLDKNIRWQHWGGRYEVVASA